MMLGLTLQSVKLAGEKVVILHPYPCRMTAVATFAGLDQFPLFLRSICTATGDITILLSIFISVLRNRLSIVEKFRFLNP